VDLGPAASHVVHDLSLVGHFDDELRIFEIEISLVTVDHGEVELGPIFINVLSGCPRVHPAAGFKLQHLLVEDRVLTLAPFKVLRLIIHDRVLSAVRKNSFLSFIRVSKLLLFLNLLRLVTTFGFHDPDSLEAPTSLPGATCANSLDLDTVAAMLTDTLRDSDGSDLVSDQLARWLVTLGGEGFTVDLGPAASHVVHYLSLAGHFDD